MFNLFLFEQVLDFFYENLSKMSVSLSNSKKTGLLRKYKKDDELDIMTEEQLLEKEIITAEDVIKLNKICNCKYIYEL